MEEFSYLREAKANEFGDVCQRKVRELLNKYSWSIPDNEAVSKIADLEKVVDPLAGTGYWASLLEQEGAQVAAGDLRPMFGNEFHTPGHRFTKVVRSDAVPFVQMHSDHALLLVWPPFEGVWESEIATSDIGYRAAKAYTEAGGHTIALVGEGVGSCRHYPKLLTHIEQHYRASYSHQLVGYKRSVKDFLTIYQRQERYCNGR